MIPFFIGFIIGVPLGFWIGVMAFCNAETGRLGTENTGKWGWVCKLYMYQKKFKNAKKIIPLILFLLLFPFSANAATYFVNPSTGVDTNAGTASGTAWKTIQKAQNTLKVGDILSLAAGTYNENMVAVVTRSDATSGYLAFLTLGNDTVFQTHGWSNSFTRDSATVLKSSRVRITGTYIYIYKTIAGNLAAITSTCTRPALSTTDLNGLQ